MATIPEIEERIHALWAKGHGRGYSSFGAILQGFQDLGYVECRNLSIAFRSAEGNISRLPGLAADLVRANVGVIMASGTSGARAAEALTSTIPIVIRERHGCPSWAHNEHHETSPRWQCYR